MTRQTTAQAGDSASGLPKDTTKSPSRTASRGPLPPATAALLKHARLHPPAPAGIFVPQNLTIAVAHVTLVSTPSFLSFGDSCPSAQK